MDSKLFLDQLHKIGALKFGNFTLASGKTSDFYLDLRYIPAFPSLFKEIISQLTTQIISKLRVDLLIGIPLAGVPYASVAGISSELPVQLLRKEKKEHGLKKMIEGPSIMGKMVVLIDDLISSGFSKEYAIKEIREAGGKVEDLIVLVDRREHDSNDWESKWQIKVHNLYKISGYDISEYKKSIE